MRRILKYSNLPPCITTHFPSRHSGLRALHKHGVVDAVPSSLVHDVRGTIAALLARLDIPYKVTPFDAALYQDCMDEAVRRGYAVDGVPSLRTYLRGGASYATAACRHLLDRRSKIWGAFYVGCTLSVDDMMARFPSERTNVYRFNERFVRGQAQGNGVLDALADVLHQAPDLFHPTPSNLIVTSTLNFVTANLVEHETEGMQISPAARQYATYQRMMAAAPETLVFMVFPRDIPVKDYIQALPEMMSFFNNANDVLSFYKEELSGETTNQISIMAACNKTSKLDALNVLAERTAEVFERAVEILRNSPEACETFKKFAIGLVHYHITLERYRLADLELESAPPLSRSRGSCESHVP